MQSTYPQRVGGAISRLINSIIGGNPSETLSSRTHREWTEQPDRVWIRRRRALINALFWWEDDHCRISYEFNMEWNWHSVSRYPDRGVQVFCEVPRQDQGK